MCASAESRLVRGWYLDTSIRKIGHRHELAAQSLDLMFLGFANAAIVQHLCPQNLIRCGRQEPVL